MCIIYELNKRLTIHTVSLVMERLTVALPEDFSLYGSLRNYELREVYKFSKT